MKTVCQICLKPVKISKDIASFQNVLNEVFLDIVNKNNSSDDCVFCDKCITVLEMAFAFKSEYAAAAEFISLHSTNKTHEELSLIHMYCKSHNIDENNLKVCRICLKSSRECTSFVIPLENMEKQDMLEKYLPDLVENNIRDSYICDNCSMNLTWFLTFVSDCLKAEKKIGSDGNVHKKNNSLEKLSGSEKLTERITHRNKKKYKRCPHCSYIGNQLDNHILVHRDQSKQKLFKCNICNAGFAHARSMVYHRKHVHEIDKDFSCSKCDFKTKRSGSLKRHILNLHVNKTPVKCNKCSFETTCRPTLTRHINVKHKDPSEIKKFYCDKCNYSSVSSGHVKRHVEYVHKDISEVKTHKCDLCTYICKDKSNLKKHMAKHSAEKSIKCSKCNFTTRYEVSLKMHMGHTHGDSYELFRCDLCDHSTKLKTNLKAHVKIVHNKEYEEYACHVCSFKTSRKGNLVQHVKLHDDTLEFKCKFCSFETKHRSSIIRHYRAMHNKPWKSR